VEFMPERLLWLRAGRTARIAPFHLTDFIQHGKRADSAIAHSLREFVPEEPATFSRSKLHFVQPAIYVRSSFL
jgi:hypothetical protein